MERKEKRKGILHPLRFSLRSFAPLRFNLPSPNVILPIRVIPQGIILYIKQEIFKAATGYQLNTSPRVINSAAMRMDAEMQMLCFMVSCLEQ